MLISIILFLSIVAIYTLVLSLYAVYLVLHIIEAVMDLGTEANLDNIVSQVGGAHVRRFCGLAKYAPPFIISSSYITEINGSTEHSFVLAILNGLVIGADLDRYISETGETLWCLKTEDTSLTKIVRQYKSSK